MFHTKPSLIITYYNILFFSFNISINFNTTGFLLVSNELYKYIPWHIGIFLFNVLIIFVKCHPFFFISCPRSKQRKKIIYIYIYVKHISSLLFNYLNLVNLRAFRLFLEPFQPVSIHPVRVDEAVLVLGALAQDVEHLVAVHHGLRLHQIPVRPVRNLDD